MNLSATFIARPVATALLTIGVALAGIAAFRLLPVSPLPQVDFPTISVNASLPGATELMLPMASADDRTTVYTYDAANRMTSETRLHVQFSDGTNEVANNARSYGDVTKRYEYDAAGNRTVTMAHCSP